MDLAVIKPRWTTKQEFKVDLPQNSQLEMQEVDEDNQDSKLPSIATIEERQNFAKTFSKNILDEFYQNRVPELELQL